MEYRVIWTIDLDAESPEDAARKALDMHRDPGSWATHFEVRDPQGRIQEVDLGCPAELSKEAAVYVLVPMEEGIVRDVRAFDTQELAECAERAWLTERGLADAQARERASDWGTGNAVWECEVKSQ